MPQDMSAEQLVGHLSALPARRQLVALAGPPASGKSTLARQLVAQLNQRHPKRAAIVPMDGFHFDDAVLAARGDLPRKGAPHTFDVGGLAHLLGRCWWRAITCCLTSPHGISWLRFSTLAS